MPHNCIRTQTASLWMVLNAYYVQPNLKYSYTTVGIESWNLRFSLKNKKWKHPRGNCDNIPIHTLYYFKSGMFFYLYLGCWKLRRWRNRINKSFPSSKICFYVYVFTNCASGFKLKRNISRACDRVTWTNHKSMVNDVHRTVILMPNKCRFSHAYKEDVQ